eukprot:TRINITY_DN56595_c0_g1_i1.p1 TRINITY_DN56595_c0_g1~~TRINITY_DN56595_c0_g1_i1.p1  ORF type:complete len:610 (+),score=137.01 TRINITY_DN56595_c0_g1_i1:83-1912(+)
MVAAVSHRSPPLWCSRSAKANESTTSSSRHTRVSLAFQIGWNGAIQVKKRLLLFDTKDTMLRIYETISGQTGAAPLWPGHFRAMVEDNGAVGQLYTSIAADADFSAAEHLRLLLPHNSLKDIAADFAAVHGKDSLIPLLLRLEPPESNMQLRGFQTQFAVTCSQASLRGSPCPVRERGTFLVVDREPWEVESDDTFDFERAKSEPGCMSSEFSLRLGSDRLISADRPVNPCATPKAEDVASKLQLSSPAAAAETAPVAAQPDHYASHKDVYPTYHEFVDPMGLMPDLFLSDDETSYHAVTTAPVGLKTTSFSASSPEKDVVYPTSREFVDAMAMMPDLVLSDDETSFHAVTTAPVGLKTTSAAAAVGSFSGSPPEKVDFTTFSTCVGEDVSDQEPDVDWRFDASYALNKVSWYDQSNDASYALNNVSPGIPMPLPCPPSPPHSSTMMMAMEDRDIFRAIMKGRFEDVRYLLCNPELDVRASDEKGNSLMHFWSRSTIAKAEVMANLGALLLQAGADVNAQRVRDGMTPLHHTIIAHNSRRGWLDFHKALFLMHYGADSSLRTHEGQLPIDLLQRGAKESTQEFVRLLRYGPRGVRCRSHNCLWCDAFAK